LFRRHSLISDAELRFFIKVEEVVSPHGLVRKFPGGRDDRGNTSPGRLHAPHPDSEQVLAAVSGFSCQMCRLDPSAFQEFF
jgi:hypothetical protein